MRILIVEDQQKLAQFLKRGLVERGNVVDIALNGIDGLHLALEGEYDLVVLDVLLPGMNGFDLLRNLREHKRTSVVMLTARDSVEDRVCGLEAGADDYLIKPFAFSELLARIHAVARRGGVNAVDGTVMSVGDLELDPIRRRAQRAGHRLDLTSLEFMLLSVFMRHKGEVLSRTQLAEQAWDMNFDSDSNVVEVAIRRLRVKLDEPFPEKLLHTARGMGYVLECREGGAGCHP